MKKYFLFYTFLLFSSALSFAQDEKKLLINSGELLTNGLTAHEEGNYKEAIDYYKQITRNDTNYVTALIELAVSYSADSQYAEAVAVCLEALKTPEGEEANIYNSLGSAYDELKQHDKSLQAYQKGLTYAPYDYTLWYNIGVTYEHMKDVERASNAYKKALQYNPFHPGSLNRLGQIELDKGHTVTAMLSFYMSLVSNPSSRYSVSNVTQLSNISLVKLEVSNGTSSRKGDDFYDIELMIASKIALSSKFKNETKIEDAILNQTQMVIDKLEYNSSDTGYFMQNYVPFYIAIRDKKYFSPFIYQAYSGINSEKLQSAYKKNEKTVALFRTWVYEYWNKKRTKQVVNGTGKTASFHFYNSNLVKSIGEYADPAAAEPLHVGQWVYFYTNGYKQSEGTYNKAGHKDGEWKFYYYTGGIKEISNYKDGSYDGSYQEYCNNGQLTAQLTLVDDKVQGNTKTYNECGSLLHEKTFKDGKTDGITKEYFLNGKTETVLNYSAGLLEGEQIVYYPNGAIQKKYNYQKDVLNGAFAEYFEDGSLKKKGSYAADKSVGLWLTYFDNKQLSDSGAYNNEGLAIGKWVSYYDNGALKIITMYDIKGKKNGEQKEYEKDGKLHGTYIFTEDKLISYTHYDKTGKVVSSGKEKGGVLIYKGFHPDGVTKSSEGTFKNGLQEGEWKFYNQNNYLSSIEHFEKGKLNGLATHYYSSGVVKSEKNYKNDYADGLYKAYYKNKQLKEEGYYVEDMKQGYWIGYSPNGKLDFEHYYLNDVKFRYNVNYSVSGKKLTEEYFEYGFLKQCVQFDTLGNVLITNDFPRGNGVCKFLHPNGKTELQYTFKNGEIDGTLIRNHANGKLKEKTNYIAGLRTGPVTSFDEDGKQYLKGNYKNGDADGIWTYYYPNGKVETVGKYNGDLQDSIWTNYYENGNKDSESSLVNGDYDGPITFYSPDLANKVVFVRQYVDDNVVSYTYPDKDGKLLAPIPVLNGTIEYKAYYPSGTLAVQFRIAGGSREGAFVQYYSTGQKFLQWNYLTGEKNGRQYEYYPTGAVKLDENYLYDEKDGTCKEYYPNGTLKSVEQYTYGVLNGTCIYYDINGKVTKKVFYRDGYIY